ncbi:MAG: 6-phosphogluconolactonase, partial [Gemmatimonadaceae bacterium]
MNGRRTPSDLHVYADAGALADAVTRDILDAGRERIASSGRFAIALAGGETPRAAYELIGERHGAAVDWTQVHVYFTDERFVPPDDLRSNFAMANRAWLSRVGIPAGQVHPMPTRNGSPAECAARYERRLRDTIPDQRSTFDLAIMGIGSDGHTASLFPGDDDALSERERWVLAVRAPQGTEPRDRITLTLPVINASRRVMFVASGAAKRERVAQARS